MAFVNEVRLSGRVSTEVKQAGHGPYRFQIKRGGGKKKDGSGNWPVEYFSIVAWPNNVDLASISKNLVVGAEVEVYGKLKQESWEKDGQKKSQIVVVADQITTPAAITPAYTEAEPKFTPAFADVVPARPPRERRIAEARTVSEHDPITDDDIPS